MWFGQLRFFSATVAMVAALAWFTGTHHCLLGLITQPQSAAVSGCQCSESSKGSGARNDTPSRMLACCQGLLSPNSELAQAKVKFSPILLEFRLPVVGHLLPVQFPQRTVLSTEYDTGPPVGNCFVETVLKRSLRENAPPLEA
jgi:hypothetical protein